MNRAARTRLLRIAAVFALFQKGDARREIEARLEEPDGDEAPRRIRCPKCTWQPAPASMWYCADCAHPEHFFDGCGAAWNTFETAGLCPGCGHLWLWTSCLVCGQWSLHAEWYGDDRRRIDDGR
jgi:hypothetical protein